MTNEMILMKLLGISEEIRHNKRGKSSNSTETGMQEGEKKKKHHKISPSAQNALSLLLKEGAMNQRTIAKNSNVSGQAISEVMKKLEGKELIRREQGEINNENIVSLTEKGREKAIELEEKMAKMAKLLLADFTLDEREQLCFLLEKMEKNQEKSHLGDFAEEVLHV